MESGFDRLIKWLSQTENFQYPRFLLIVWLTLVFALSCYTLYGFLRVVSENQRLSQSNDELSVKNKQLEK